MTRDLRHFWYPLVSAAEVVGSTPVKASLFGEPLVLFRDDGGQIRCLRDVCPHRCVPLSAGEVVGGELQCMYHGWRFDGSGRCSHIPARNSVARLSPRLAGRFSWEDVVVTAEGLSARAVFSPPTDTLRVRFELRAPTTVRVESILFNRIQIDARYHIIPLGRRRSRGLARIGVSVPGPSVLSSVALASFYPMFLKGIAEDKTVLRLQQETLDQGYVSRAAGPADQVLLAYEKWRKALDHEALWSS